MSYYQSDGSARLHNVCFDGNTIFTSNSNQDLTLNPNGTGKVAVSKDLDLASGKYFRVNGTIVLSANTLAPAVTLSSLTSVGALASGSLAIGFGSISTENNITTSATLSGDSVVSALDVTINSAANGLVIDGVTVINKTTLGSTVTTSSLTSVGALASGSITSGFGTINPGSSNITTTGTVSADAFVSTSTDADLTITPNGTGKITLAKNVTLNQGLSLTFTAISNTDSPYTVLSTDKVLLCSLSAPITINLPTAVSNSGRLLIIKDRFGQAGTNNLTIDANSTETIDGSLTRVITNNFAVCQLLCDGSNNWSVVN